MRLCITVVILAAVSLVAGCAIYTFSGNVPGHLKTVAIPAFENQTAEFGLVEKLTDELVDRFILDNSLKVRDLRDANSAVFGTIVRIEDIPFSYSADETVEEYKVTVVVRVRFEDLVKAKIVWEETLSQFGVYPFSGGSSAQREEGIDKAVEKLSEDILNKTVSGW